jgi:hypothetical protein
MAELFIKGLLVHLLVDWFLQSDWISEHKADLRHPAGWVHGGLYAAGNLLVFSAPIAIALGLAHVLLDTRKPLAWLRRLLQQHPQGAVAPVFEIGQDQAAHLILLGVAVLVS